MKKGLILVVIIVGLLSVSTAAFAAADIAIGAEAASQNFNDWGGRFVFHLPHIPLYFGIGGIAESGGFALDVTVDYWFAHSRLSGMLDYYVGIGGYLALGAGNQSSFDLGARLPIGLQVWPVGRVLEIFLEVAPAWIPISNSGLDALTFQVQPAIGFRLWL